jgi:hypothetical protein
MVQRVAGYPKVHVYVQSQFVSHVAAQVLPQYVGGVACAWTVPVAGSCRSVANESTHSASRSSRIFRIGLLRARVG